MKIKKKFFDFSICSFFGFQTAFVIMGYWERVKEVFLGWLEYKNPPSVSRKCVGRARAVVNIIHSRVTDEEKLKLLSGLFNWTIWTDAKYMRVLDMDLELHEVEAVRYSDMPSPAPVQTQTQTQTQPQTQTQTQPQPQPQPQAPVTKPTKGLLRKLHTLLHKKVVAAAPTGKFHGVDTKLLHDSRFSNGGHLDKLANAAAAAPAGDVKNLMTAWHAAEKALQADPYAKQAAQDAVDAVETLL